MLQALLPVLGHQPAIFDQCIHITGQRQRDHIGINAVNHRPRLLARAAVRLLDRDNLASLGPPVFDEGGVVVHVQLAGRVVGHIEQRDRRRLGMAGQRRAGQSQGDCCVNGKVDKVAT